MHVYYLVPVPWKGVIDGSIDELFKCYNDWWVRKNDKIKPAMTIEHVKLFYTKLNKVTQLRINRELPAKEDMVYDLD